MLWQKVGFMIFGMVMNCFAAVGGTMWYLSIAMSGFDASQSSLSAQMQSLQGSLDSVRQVSDSQVSEARGDLSRQIEKLTASINGLSNRLGDKLEENSEQLSALNATIAGLDKRLADSIERQRVFETIVLQRIVYQGPLLKSDNKESVEVLQDWQNSGYQGQLVTSPASEAEFLNQWDKLNLTPKQ